MVPDRHRQKPPNNQRTRTLWTPDGTGLVFSSNRGGLWFVPVTRRGAAGGEPRLLRGDMGRFSPIGFGRDEALFYLVTDGSVDVSVADVDLGAGTLSAPRTIATRFLEINLFSDWSSDSRALMFTSRRGEVGFERRSQVIVIRDPASNDERVLAPDLTGLAMPRWSPDGRTVLVRGDGPQGSGIYRVSVSTGEVSLFLDQAVGFPEWGPGGSRVFFLAPGQPRPALRVRDLDTNTDRTLAEDAFLFSVARNGERFAIARRTADGDRIFAGSVNGGPLRELFKLPAKTVTELAGWTPDGLELIISQRERPGPQGPRKPTDILAVPTAGGAPRRIARLTLTDPRTFRLSPDGTKLSFEAGYPSQSMWVLEQFLDAAR